MPLRSCGALLHACIGMRGLASRRALALCARRRNGLDTGASKFTRSELAFAFALAFACTLHTECLLCLRRLSLAQTAVPPADAQCAGPESKGLRRLACAVLMVDCPVATTSPQT